MILASVCKAVIITTGFCDSIIFKRVIIICLNGQEKLLTTEPTNFFFEYLLEIPYRQLAIAVLDANHEVHKNLCHVIWIGVLLC